MSERKQDTRRKIQLGGLIIKAGLDQEESAIILGALLRVVSALKSEKGEAIRKQLREEGDKAFLKDKLAETVGNEPKEKD